MGTAQIELTSRKYPGLFVTVDEEDVERLSQHKWYPFISKRTTYATTNLKINGVWKSRILMHRILTEAPAGMDVDHINRNGLDNTRANLRIVTRSQNMRNMKRDYGTSQFSGVSWHTLVNKWVAYITHNRKRTIIGYFSDEVEAAKARDKVAMQLHGPYARLNFPGVTP